MMPELSVYSELSPIGTGSPYSQGSPVPDSEMTDPILLQPLGHEVSALSRMTQPPLLSTTTSGHYGALTSGTMWYLTTSTCVSMSELYVSMSEL